MCKRRHSGVLCPGNSTSQTTSNLTSEGSNATLLQTVMVKLIDNGAQRTYIKEDVAKSLVLHGTGKKVLTHNLFRGVQVKSSVCAFELNLSALEQSVICNNLPNYVKDNDCDILIKRHGIIFTDSDNGQTDNSLLFSADYSGYIMTNTMVMLKEGLFAIKTRLGWVLQDKVNNLTAPVV